MWELFQDCWFRGRGLELVGCAGVDIAGVNTRAHCCLWPEVDRYR